MALFKNNKKQQPALIDPKPTVEAAKTTLNLPSVDDKDIRDRVKIDARKQKARKGVASTLISGQVSDVPLSAPMTKKNLLGGGY